jgi:superfamily II DNA or RNA helicase
MHARRRFRGSERAALYLAADGRCSRCGLDLAPGWHADHIRPHAGGGITDVLNGQALCPTCNLKKGHAMLPDWPSTKPLRRWQQRAFNKYLPHEAPDFLAVATPGAGKTTFALRVAHEALRRGRQRFLVVVVPSEHLKSQWAEAAASVGIHLDPAWSNASGAVAADYHGVVVTYAQVAANPDIHRRLCRLPVLAIFDEVHHAGDDLAWGSSLRHAYEAAARRLLLSGTPFRSDNSPIPFVRYVEGLSRADFTYSYAESLGDQVCRPILFPSYEGRMEWYSRGRKLDHTFRDALGDQAASQRLKTALDPGGLWVRQVIQDADAKLSQVRETHADAGGLVVAVDCRHAERVAEILRSVAGEEPAVATVDDPDASRTIREYGVGRRRWIVAVRMISEGVDIPRLRVGVYATNVLTEMFFRQVVGRFVRMIPALEDQNAYLYIPRDETLVDYAQQIKEERDHQLVEEAERPGQGPGEAADTDDKVLSLFLAISSTGHADDVIVDRDLVSQDEIREAGALGQKCGSREDPAILARIIREVRGAGFNVKAEAKVEAKPESPAAPLHVRKKQLRNLVKRLVAQIREATGGEEDYQSIYAALMRRDNVYQEQATIEQLGARVEFLRNWVEDLCDGRGR